MSCSFHLRKVSVSPLFGSLQRFGCRPETPSLLAPNVSDYVIACSSQGSLVKKMFDNVVLPGARSCPPSFRSDMDCDVYICQNVYADMVLSNGANMCMTKELTALAPSSSSYFHLVVMHVGERTSALYLAQVASALSLQSS